MMQSIKMLLSPSNDGLSPPKVKQRIYIRPANEMDKVILRGESSSSDCEIDDTKNNKPIEESTCALIQPGAPGYFNDSMKVLNDMLTPLSQIECLVNCLMSSIDHGNAEATEAKNIAVKAQAENKALQTEVLEIKRKQADLETKYDSLQEKIIQQEDYNRCENLVFEGIACS